MSVPHASTDHVSTPRLLVGHVFTQRSHGDLAVSADPALLAARRSAVPGVPDEPWVWLEQVHGAEVVVATGPGQGAGSRADAVMTTSTGVPVAIHTADCAPVLVVADRGLAVVHAGWRGLLAGVLEAALEALSARGLVAESMVLGPMIRPRCYEFAAADLEPLVARFGATVRSTTAWGAPALDLAAAVSVVAAEHGLEVEDEGTCTACSPAHWSHRAGGDRGRQALVAWLETARSEPDGVVALPEPVDR